MAQDHSQNNDKLPVVGDAEPASSAEAALDSNTTATEEASSTAKVKPNLKAPRRSGLAVFCLLLIVVLGGAGGWFGWQMWQQLALLENNVPANDAPAVASFDPTALNREINTLKNRLGQQDKRFAQLQAERADTSQLNSLGQQQAAMERRLQALSDTSRDDWKLAEAAFLLRLASQRMLIEHNSSEAIALTQAADTILRDQNDPDLFGVRQTLARELTELKMVQPVDREGLYARLQSLTEQVAQLKQLHSYQREALGPDNTVTSEPVAQGVWAKVKASFGRALSTMSSYVRVRDREQEVAPLLPPEQRYFLTQNLRLMLEQAQLGLLREQPRIYHQSLERSQQWIAEYFEQNNRSKLILEELAQLQQEPVVVELPDINQALGQLQAYIQKLHRIEAGGTP
ncbi:uroporphyrinogen-III C-methyltransferase [Gilvimarinus polysaccharolyticus]|uniref:uroporphyrinogen-III C-methyltransferase n=1 Tax=Gilvimarinus polysaccharolyticus TaxID=863921 RepID=UPI0006735F00|nr:uroporphyrinogen-III C-methyltransferase [Gilvimarinus polysaccharolyticus]